MEPNEFEKVSAKEGGFQKPISSYKKQLDDANLLQQFDISINKLPNRLRREFTDCIEKAKKLTTNDIKMLLYSKDESLMAVLITVDLTKIDKDHQWHRIKNFDIVKL